MWLESYHRTIDALNPVGTLALVNLLGGDKGEYGRLAKKLLMEVAAWDPLGSTDYRYNDESGMRYAFGFSRAYTLAYHLLTEADREKCRQVMRIRGDRMYRYLYPKHLWRPYSSHRNRSWHYLGEIAVAFRGEIPEADDWLWFAMNVFFNVYPVWCDDDGGWHEGISYWRRYMELFTHWASIMKATMGINAYQLPFFSKTGYYAMYLQPPGTEGGAFGDLSAKTTSARNCRLLTILAAQAGNPHWQWYANAVGKYSPGKSYFAFLQGALRKVEPKPPTDLPSSRCFRGVGLAVLNTNLLDGTKNVELALKSDPFGSLSCGCDAQNSFVFYAFGKRLLIRTGRRDAWSSAHHAGWVWDTKSTNCITINGQSQKKHTADVGGRIASFYTSKDYDYVLAKADKTYGPLAKRFDRHVLFVKPDLVVMCDRIETPEPARFEWWLHALNEMDVRDQTAITVQNGKALCRVSLLTPAGLTIRQTDRFEPPPLPKYKLRQWHLSAQTAQPTACCEFVTLIRPYREGDPPPFDSSIEQTPYGYRLKAALREGHVLVALRSADDATVELDGLKKKAALVAMRFDGKGNRTWACSFPAGESSE